MYQCECGVEVEHLEQLRHGCEFDPTVSHEPIHLVTDWRTVMAVILGLVAAYAWLYQILRG